MNDDRLAEIRSTRIGFIFQSYNLLSALTVVENIEVPLYYSQRINAETKRRCCELAELVGLEQSAQSSADAAFRRSAAARGDRPQPGERSRVHSGRRTDRQSRLGDDQRNSWICSNG